MLPRHFTAQHSHPTRHYRRGDSQRSYRFHGPTKRDNYYTTTAVSTTRYEAPELQKHNIDTMSTRLLSRTFDVWSLGCIWAEFVIWLLYGFKEGYDRFTTHTDGKPFWRDSQGNNVVDDMRVIESVDWWLEAVEIQDGRCGTNTALGQLVGLIRKRLLVVKVETLHSPANQSGAAASSSTPPTTPSSRKRFSFRAGSSRKQSGSRPSTADTAPAVYRATADEATKELKEITRRLQHEKGFKAAGEINTNSEPVPDLLSKMLASTPSGDVPGGKVGGKGSFLRELLRRRKAA